MGEFLMPSLGADMESGTIVEWKIKPGDEVQRGDIVAVVDTEKSDIEVEIFEAGTVQDIIVPAGETVPVGAVLAHISGHDEPAITRPVEPPITQPVEPPVQVLPGVISPLVRHRAQELGVDLARVVGTGLGGMVHRSDVERAAEDLRTKSIESEEGSAGEFVRASPRARRRALELGVDMAELTGSGEQGAVTLADVEKADVEKTDLEKANGRDVQRPSMRRAIAGLMERSNREIPHYYLQTTIDLQPALDWLTSFNLERPVTERILPVAMLLKATAHAAVEVPEMNGFWIEDGFQPGTSVHLGVAISLRGGGLVAPAILDADKCTLVELMVRLRDLVQRARSGVLRASEMSAPTLSVSNLGDQGAEVVYGVIYPPQVALVGFGKITERPWAHERMVGVRSVVTATIAADHRASDGHNGGLFLKAIERRLQRPEEL